MKLLFGWKSVAAWFHELGVKVHLRTLRDWKARRGLPVKSIMDGRVVAYPLELEVWVQVVLLAATVRKSEGVCGRSRQSVTRRRKRD